MAGGRRCAGGRRRIGLGCGGSHAIGRFSIRCAHRIGEHHDDHDDHDDDGPGDNGADLASDRAAGPIRSVARADDAPGTGDDRLPLFSRAGPRSDRAARPGTAAPASAAGTAAATADISAAAAAEHPVAVGDVRSATEV